MASNLVVTQEFQSPNWVVTATVQSGSTLPSDIFIYENTGTNVLGKYVSICSFSELQRLRVWDGSVIPLFGNKYVRYHQAKIVLSTIADAGYTIDNLRNSATQLSTELTNNSTVTAVIPIP